MDNDEIWKPIKDYDDSYEISDKGRVKSLDRHVENNNGMQHRSEKILKPHKKSNGYETVALCKNGEVKVKSVHRLVAEAFLDNKDNKPCVDHIDTNPSNNNVNNLKWVTHKENQNNEITRKHLSESKKGHPYHPIVYTDEIRQKMRNAQLGKKASEETRKKLSESHMGHKNSEETRKKLSESLKGHEVSEETRKKLSESHKGLKKDKHWRINEGGKREWY